MYSSCRIVINNISGSLAIKWLVPVGESRREERCCNERKVVRQAPRALLNAVRSDKEKRKEERKETLFPCVEQFTDSCLVPWDQAERGREKDVLAAFQAGPTSNSLMSIGGKLN